MPCPTKIESLSIVSFPNASCCNKYGRRKTQHPPRRRRQTVRIQWFWRVSHCSCQEGISDTNIETNVQSHEVKPSVLFYKRWFSTVVLNTRGGNFTLLVRLNLTQTGAINHSTTRVQAVQHNRTPSSTTCWQIQHREGFICYSPSASRGRCSLRQQQTLSETPQPLTNALSLTLISSIFRFKT